MSTRLAYAVVDSGPLIRGLRLETLNAERLVTVPEVLREIRDQRTRQMLESLPVELETREPSHEAMEAITNFAKLTGDLPGLSVVDKRVLALAYMCEKEAKGGVGHLRTEPFVPTDRKPTSNKSKEDTSDDFYGAAEAEGGWSTHGAAHAHAHAHAHDVPDGPDLYAQSHSHDGGGAAEAGAAMDVSDAAGTTAAAETKASGGGGSSAAASTATAPPAPPAADSSGLDEDLPWITVENLEETQRLDPSSRAMVLDADTKVATLTTDYAMQSVLMQMGLKLMGSDGLLMRSVKQWVLRCSGCFTMQPSLDKQFCVKCGNTSLVRLQAVIDAKGFRRVLPEAGAPARVRSTNTRGTKFPLPQPKAGRHANNLILAEDQLDEAMSKHRRQRKNKGAFDHVFDQDYSLDDHFGRTGKKVGGGGSGSPRVGYGKRANPNDVRSRPKNT